jgi:hypothetical protein
MKQRFALVLIEWEDAYTGNHDWFKLNTLPDAVQPVMVVTAGFVVLEDEERVTLAQTFSHNSGANLWTIPVGMIRKRTHLRMVTVERGDEEDEG